jgi:hypothetical protein
MSASIVVTGLKDALAFFDEFPEIATTSAVLAVNDTADKSVPPIKRKMVRQINFPRDYLNASRLGVRRRATRGSLEAVISGRDRPTSLARFAPGATPENSKNQPIFLRVKPGRTTKLVRGDGKPSAFLLRLKNGNIGLAVRLRKGETLRNSDKAVNLGENLYLLYGPSVDQVLQDVATQETPDISDRLTNSFLRQFTRLSRG